MNTKNKINSEAMNKDSVTDNRIDVRVKLSMLWIVVMMNMIFADIFSILLELEHKGTLGEMPVDAKMMMAIAAILTNIPILMIYFARTLPYKSNRMLNIIAGSFTILYIISGGVLLPHYLIIGSVEVVILSIIVVKAWKWRYNSKTPTRAATSLRA